MKHKKPQDKSKYKYHCEYCGDPFKNERTLSTHTVAKHRENFIDFAQKLVAGLETPPSEPTKTDEKVGNIVSEISNEEPILAENLQEIATIEPSKIVEPPQEKLRQKEDETDSLQQRINQTKTGGDEMAEGTAQPAQGSTVDLLLQVKDLQHTIANTQEKLKSLEEDKLPRAIKDTTGPLEEKVKNELAQLAEVTKTTTSLSETLSNLQENLAEEVARQAEAKKERETLKSELEETKTKADTISTLGEELKTSLTGVLDEKTKDWDEKLAQLPTEEKVKELVDACILDPDGSACKRLDELEKATIGETELEKSVHSTAAELLACPTCGVAVTKRIMAALSEQGKGDISDSFLEAMSKSGYETGVQPKPEEPVVAEAPSNPGEEKKAPVPAGF